MKIKTRRQHNKKRFLIHTVTIFLCACYIFCLYFGMLLALYNATRIPKPAIESGLNDDLLFSRSFYLIYRNSVSLLYDPMLTLRICMSRTRYNYHIYYETGCIIKLETHIERCMQQKVNITSFLRFQ